MKVVVLGALLIGWAILCWLTGAKSILNMVASYLLTFGCWCAWSYYTPSGAPMK